MTQFEEDLSCEQIINKHIETQFISTYFEEYEMISDLEEQKQGIDVKCKDNNGKEYNIDIKTQQAYINNPYKSFTLEIGEELQYSDEFKKGWFIQDNQTTHYLFTWITKADKIDVVDVCGTRFIRLEPYTPLETIPDYMKKQENTLFRNNTFYGFPVEDLHKFEEDFYELEADLNEIVSSGYSPVVTTDSIIEHHALLVSKQKIKEKLEEYGLDTHTLQNYAENMTEGSPIQFDTENNTEYSSITTSDIQNVEKLMKHTINGQHPINLKVLYDFYKDIATETFTSTEDSVTTGTNFPK